jgi:hypothetical protein
MTLPVFSSVVVAGEVTEADTGPDAGTARPASGVLVVVAAVAGAELPDPAIATPAVTAPTRTTSAAAPAMAAVRRRVPAEPEPSPAAGSSPVPFPDRVMISFLSW